MSWAKKRSYQLCVNSLNHKWFSVKWTYYSSPANSTAFEYCLPVHSCSSRGQNYCWHGTFRIVCGIVRLSNRHIAVKWTERRLGTLNPVRRKKTASTPTTTSRRRNDTCWQTTRLIFWVVGYEEFRTQETSDPRHFGTTWWTRWWEVCFGL